MLEDRDPAALDWLAQRSPRCRRRTLVLRMRSKAARQARQTTTALATARMLAKHRAPAAAQSLSEVWP
jgi:HemY protein